MKQRIRRLTAGIAIAAAAVTGTAVAHDIVAAPQQDTTWGAPDTPDDTTWGTPPADTPNTSDGPVITPLDTTWG